MLQIGNNGRKDIPAAHMCRVFISVGVLSISGLAQAQVSDLLSAFDAGSRASGAGGSLSGASADTFATSNNPGGLGFVDRPQVQYAQKNLSSFKNVASGKYEDPTLNGSEDRGSTRYTHFGVVFPVSQFRPGASGNIGFSYDLGGYLEDTITVKSDLSYGSGFVIKNFSQKRKVTQDLYTLAYGNNSRKGSVAYGFGLTVVNQKLDFAQTGSLTDSNGTPVPGGGGVIPAVSANGIGIGIVAGLQYIPPNHPDRSMWASLRTPISISDGGSDAASLTRIPGRLILGAAQRLPGLAARKDDYLVVAAQLQAFFGGSSNKYFDQQSGTAFGIGLEYTLNSSSYIVPLRLGYQRTAASGTFDSRQGITYGIGYSPDHMKYSIDLNYFRPSTGSYDFALTATYRF